MNSISTGQSYYCFTDSKGAAADESVLLTRSDGAGIGGGGGGGRGHARESEGKGRGSKGGGQRSEPSYGGLKGDVKLPLEEPSSSATIDIHVQMCSWRTFVRGNQLTEKPVYSSELLIYNSCFEIRLKNKSLCLVTN